MKYIRRLLHIFLAILFWIFTITAVVVIIYYKDAYEAYEAIKSIDPGQHISGAKKLTGNLENIDTWNQLYMSILAGLLLILFYINDKIVKKITIRRKKKKKKKIYSQQTKEKKTRQRNKKETSREISLLWKTLTWTVSKSTVTIMVIIEFIIITNLTIFAFTFPKIKGNTDRLEESTWGLLLGTNKNLRTKEGENLYYNYRIDAAEELYKAGKIKKIVISGDNHVTTYNEPLDMMYDLMKRGIPKSIVTNDFAGFRTLDSTIRLKYAFGVDKVIIISQAFHLERALFLAWYYDIEAVGYQAEGSMTRKMILRELLAKPKVFLDIFIFNIQPKFGKTPPRKQLTWENDKHKPLIVTATTILLLGIVFFVRSFFDLRISNA